MEPRFNGPAYNPDLDQARLSKQLDRIRDLMLDGKWRTLGEIQHITNDPQASISAQLRHLRKARFGGYTVDRRRRGEEKSGLWEYRVQVGDGETTPADEGHVRIPSDRMMREALTQLRLMVTDRQKRGLVVSPAIVCLGKWLAARYEQS